eukprot:m51a1_g6595 hypothetical protein (819) ;mRNA; f:279679-298066
MGDKVIVEIVLADVRLTESQQDVLARGLQASAHRHAEDHFFTYLKWSLDIMRDTAQSVSKESITKAGVKQTQAGEKQKKMKESTLDNKKIKATSELNVSAIESKGVLFSKFFESQNNCKKVALIASKLMTWKPEDVQKLFHEISKIEGIDKIPSSALEMTTLWSLSVDNVLRFIRCAATEKLTRDQCRQLFQSIQDSYHIYSLIKDLISALDSDDKEQRSFSKTQLRVLKNAVCSSWLSDYVDCPASDFELVMGPVTAAIMWGKLTKESEINAASKNMEKNSILSEKPVMVNWNELVYPAKVYKEVSLEFSRCMDRCCTNFFLRDCWTQCYGLYKSFRPNIMLVDMSALQSPDDLRDYIPKLNPLVIPLIPTGEHVWDQTPNRHIHYNLVVNFLSSKARDKFTSLLKSTFLALKSDPLELLHGSSKPTIDYTTVHDLLHFMSIAALELTGDKPMHRYLTEISFEHSLLEIGAPFGLAPLRWALRSRAGDSDKDEPAAAAAVTDDISITKGKSSSVTKKQKPKASTASAVISPTPQSHAELETTDKDPEEHADKNKDSEKPDEPEKPGETEKPDETELPEEPEPANFFHYYAVEKVLSTKELYLRCIKQPKRSLPMKPFEFVPQAQTVQLKANQIHCRVALLTEFYDVNPEFSCGLEEAFEVERTRDFLQGVGAELRMMSGMHLQTNGMSEHWNHIVQDQRDNALHQARKHKIVIEAAYRVVMAGAYDKKHGATDYKVSDTVWKTSNTTLHHLKVHDTDHKLMAWWNGPFIMAEACGSTKQDKFYNGKYKRHVVKIQVVINNQGIPMDVQDCTRRFTIT